MLVLSRRVNEQIIVDGPCVIQVCEVRGDRAKIGIIAARSVNVRRAELPDRKGRDEK